MINTKEIGCFFGTLWQEGLFGKLISYKSAFGTGAGCSTSNRR